jgi:hypothetical protein
VEELTVRIWFRLKSSNDYQEGHLAVFSMGDTQAYGSIDDSILSRIAAAHASILGPGGRLSFKQGRVDSFQFVHFLAN